jgi:dethiobiotin synthetase
LTKRKRTCAATSASRSHDRASDRRGLHPLACAAALGSLKLFETEATLELTRLFVTGTDTHIGKTEVSCAVLSWLARDGGRPVALKPYESGMSSLRRPSDSLALQAAGGGWQPLDTISLARFRAPLAPGMAARGLSPAGKRAHARVFAQVVRRVRQVNGPLVVEGAGGLAVPLDDRHDVIDLVEVLRLPVLLVARAGLGTVNHTTLSLEALAARGARVAGCVLVQATPARDASMPLNRAELERRFPSVRFVGPVPFIEDAQRRRKRLVQALRPLLEA